MTLSQAEFAFVSTLVRREASIVLAPGKEYLVEARLIPVARTVGAANVNEFLADLQRRPDPANQRRIIEALTTNETSWFRDREPFAALTDVVLPELVKSRASTRRVRIWSAASSSGQEAYSLAITLQETLPAGWSYEIMGTDISTEVIDVIFLRNVLIYFDVATKRTVLQNVAKLLRPDGWLFLGAAETTIGIDDNYERVAAGRTSAYRVRTGVPAGAVRRS
jgi:chemotaxis methyl-accepting protein methylase